LEARDARVELVASDASVSCVAPTSTFLALWADVESGLGVFAEAAIPFRIAAAGTNMSRAEDAMRNAILAASDRDRAVLAECWTYVGRAAATGPVDTGLAAEETGCVNWLRDVFDLSETPDQLRGTEHTPAFGTGLQKSVLPLFLRCLCLSARPAVEICRVFGAGPKSVVPASRTVWHSAGCDPALRATRKGGSGT